MERIRNLDRYPKVLLVALVAMAVVFCAVYAVVISREGYLYNDQILVPGTDNGNTVYTTKVFGEEWRFTVTPDKTVTFRCGNKQYGPYTAKEDPTAIPAENGMANSMTGVEVRERDEIIFRGGIVDVGSMWIMVNEDGTDASITVRATMSDGTVITGDGEIVDPMDPSVASVLRLMKGPELTHKGEGFLYFFGVFISLIAAVHILFADELFRWHFIFRARDPDLIEPSDWELGIRPVAWTLLVLVALVSYLMGLQ